FGDGLNMVDLQDNLGRFTTTILACKRISLKDLESEFPWQWFPCHPNPPIPRFLSAPFGPQAKLPPCTPSRTPPRGLEQLHCPHPAGEPLFRVNRELED